MKRIIRILVLATMLSVLLVSYTFADTINIPTDYSTIQEGINASTNGDTVLVQPGTYFENIWYYGKRITVGSLFLTTQDTSYISQTIIDGNHNETVVKFYHGEDNTTTLCGLTITNGLGGGIRCWQASPNLLDLIIIGNNFGGICLGRSSATIKNAVIKNNTDSSGGGISCTNHSNPYIINCTISSNTANQWDGGGISCSGYSHPYLINCTISNNSAVTEGGGIHTHYSSIDITNSIISDNAGNTGIYCAGIHNCTISYSCIWNNEGGNFYQCGANTGVNVTTNANGDSCDIFYNIQINPCFVDTMNSDYHLIESSSCIDAGDPTSSLDPDGTISDIGAYYFPHLKPNFLADPIFGYNNLTVDFADASESYVSNWFWDFESDGIFDDFIQNPSHIYNQPGIYDVTLKIEYDSLSLVDTLVKVNCILIQESQLQPPQNPIITMSGDDIILHWDTVVNANYYLIYIATDPYGYFEFLDYTTGITAYTHSGVATTNNKMFYVIIGFDGTMEELPVLSIIIKEKTSMLKSNSLMKILHT